MNLIDESVFLKYTHITFRTLKNKDKMSSTRQIIEDTEKYSVHNYDRLPLVARKAKGVWVWDIDGRKYVDMLSSYGANSLGHNHPRVVSALCEHLKRDGISSMPGGFYNEPYGKLVKALSEFCGFEKVICKTGGSEAIEAMAKLVKRWGYSGLKGIPSHENAEIIGCVNNFHGRLPTALGLSTEMKYKRNFGPFPAGLRSIAFGDPDALGRAIKPNTAAFLTEVIQGEGGINVWPDGALKEVEKICWKKNVLFVVDEVQTGLGRTGYDFAYEREGVKPDIVVIAKALGGGLMPVSAVLTGKTIMNLIGPGDEGSTFGNHPLSCVAALEALAVLQEENLTEKAKDVGNYLKSRLISMESPLVKEVRGRGLMVGVELVPGVEKAKYYCRKLLELGVICEKARDNVIRFSPPLIITRADIDWAMERIEKVFRKELRNE